MASERCPATATKEIEELNGEFGQMKVIGLWRELYVICVVCIIMFHGLPVLSWVVAVKMP
jgi:hypothetical protein